MSWNDYYVWLVVISVAVFICERLLPWRSEQKVFRGLIAQDFFWLLLNGHVLGLGLGYVISHLEPFFNELCAWLVKVVPGQVELISAQPFFIKLIVFIILKDFIEWNIHRLLHKVDFLWQFHKLHHSIVEMDWIGNMRFHWMEIIVYKTLSYLPLVLLGVSWDVVLVSAILSTLIGHLNHSNLKISWGPLRYLFNSPMMHIWHHDVVIHATRGEKYRSGQNFAIMFSVWDWVFGTVYWPKEQDQPEQLGFDDMDLFPDNFFLRLIYPLLRKKK